jgi:hypothetical protein
MMGWARRLASRWKDPEKRVWFVVAGWAAVLTALVVIASVSYSTLILAHAAVGLTSSRTVGFTGMPAGGGLSDTGSVNLTLTLAVRNPSPRPLAFASLAYKAWIEDLPMEAGLPNLGRTDNVLTNGTGTYFFFMALLGSSSVTPTPIPPTGSGTLTLSFVLSRTSDAARFRAVQNITEFAAHVRGNGAASSWVHWVEVVVAIRDLPTPSPSASPFLGSLTRIILREGYNLG